MSHQIDDLLDGLSESMRCLASSICENTSQRTIEFDWLRSHAGFATKHDLKEMEKRIMSAISEYTEAVDTKFAEIGTSVDEVVAAIAGVTGDVASLKDIILKLESNPGPISPEDQILLTSGVAKVTALSDRLKSVSAALKELDAATAGEAVPSAPPE